MAQTNVQAFSGDVEIAGGLSITGSVTSTAGIDKVNLATDGTSANRPVIFTTGTTGAQPLKTDAGITYNPSSNKLTVSGGLSTSVTPGNYLTGSAYDGSTARTFDVDATSYATVSKIVARDSNGDFNARYVNGEYMNMSHSASDRNSDTVFYSSTDNYIRKTTASGMRSSLNVPTRTGGNASGSWGINITGSAGSAGTATTAADNSSNLSRYLTFVDLGTAANQVLKTDTSISYNPSTNILTAGAFVGDGSALTGIYNAAVDTIKIGNGAGTTGQGANSVAVGYNAATTSQGANAVAVGNQAGSTGQGTLTVAVGVVAGQTSQGGFATAVGYAAGQTSQGASSTALGREAGQTNQGSFAVAVGYQAGETMQGANATALGWAAGQTSQAILAVAVGWAAGQTGQRNSAVAVGVVAGQSTQGSNAVAVGREAGLNSQGNQAVALGYAAGHTSQPASSFYVGTACVRNQGGTWYMRYNTSTGEVSYTSSDDRIKDGETFITGAVETLSKLRPQTYFKRTKLDPTAPEQNWYTESGLMAQEVYYSAPELRHLVGVPAEAGDIDNFTPPPSDDPSQDPDYSIWGDGIATVDYMQMVPYLVKGVQEIVTELPRSKTTVSNTWGQNITGLVVSANTNKHKTNTVPIVNLSTVSMDKSWYGVVSNEKTDSIDYDTLVDIKGDSQIWVTDLGGTLESGDLLTTSNVAPGYTQKQEGGALMNYTVAKVTQDCDFTEPSQISIKIPKRELSNVTYYLHDESYEIGLHDYERTSTIKTRFEEIPIYFKEGGDTGIDKFYQGDTEISPLKYEALPEDAIKSTKTFTEISVEEYNALDAETKATYSLGTHKKYIHVQFSKSKKQIPQHDEVRIIEELVDILDENGQTVWEETGNTVPVYTLVDHGTYKAALVSCKLI